MGEEASRQQRACNREMTVKKNLSLDIEKHPRDLLRSFMSENGGERMIHSGETTDCEDESRIELNLGLSLGGRFGVDKSPWKLKRSSSVLEPFENSTLAEPVSYSVGLARTTSLPAEMEEEWRKREEILKRMDTKRRRFEKQSFRTGDQTASFETEIWVANKQVSVDSDGGGGGGSSSSLSELDNKNQQDCFEGSNEDEKGVRGKDIATDLFDMPCVFTKGDGPNGRRVDGILYKYLKGEQVRIMCICHGSFLTPSEFVKHGGGDDVDHPLRHILVNTSSSTF